MADPIPNRQPSPYNDKLVGPEQYEGVVDIPLMAEEGEDFAQDSEIKRLAEHKMKYGTAQNSLVIKYQTEPSANTVGKGDTGKDIAIRGKRSKQMEVEMEGIGSLPFWLKTPNPCRRAIGLLTPEPANISPVIEPNS